MTDNSRNTIPPVGHASSDPIAWQPVATPSGGVDVPPIDSPEIHPGGHVTNLPIPDIGSEIDPKPALEPSTEPTPSRLSQLKQRIVAESGGEGSRKPFLMGMLAGIILMLLLGQIFRATQPAPDYAQSVPPAVAEPSSDASVAFIDRVPDGR